MREAQSSLRIGLANSDVGTRSVGTIPRKRSTRARAAVGPVKLVCISTHDSGIPIGVSDLGSNA